MPAEQYGEECKKAIDVDDSSRKQKSKGRKMDPKKDEMMKKTYSNRSTIPKEDNPKEASI